MYSKEIQRLERENVIKVIKAIILFGLFITLFFIHMSMLYHVISSCLCGYYMLKNIFGASDNYMKIVQLKAKQSKQDEFNKYSSDDFNRIINDLFEKFKNQQYQQQSQQNRTYSPFNQGTKLKNAYLLFKLPSTSSVEEIKTKYRELAFKWHPDKWTTDTISNQNIAKRNFQKLQSAYDLIKKDKGIN